MKTNSHMAALCNFQFYMPLQYSQLTSNYLYKGKLEIKGTRIIKFSRSNLFSMCCMLNVKWKLIIPYKWK